MLKNILLAAFSLMLVTATSSLAQTKTVAAAPIPPRVLAAKKVFVANGGKNEYSTDLPQYSGGQDRAYDQLCAALKAGNRYEVVNDPSDADVVFEIEFYVQVSGSHPSGIAISGIDPQFRLSIRDPKSNVLLWRFTRRSPFALLEGNRDRNFDEGLKLLVSDVESLGGATQPASAK